MGQLQHPVGGQCSGVRGFQIDEHRDELVAAETSQGVAVAKPGRQQLSNLAENLVADAVAVGVVDRLEMVEVDEQRAEAPASTFGSRRAHTTRPVR
jgi:hypothetical protein